MGALKELTHVYNSTEGVGQHRGHRGGKGRSRKREEGRQSQGHDFLPQVGVENRPLQRYEHLRQHRLLRFVSNCDRRGGGGKVHTINDRDNVSDDNQGRASTTTGNKATTYTIINGQQLL